ncbi:unknown [Clostridium sp. CAG:356]|jgi:hypothetical protein|nr:MAG: hypothetical protein BHW02_02405 [Clostridium sp. 28_12]CDD36913.1 unknown [Clostridium sp. CAG:356]
MRREKIFKVIITLIIGVVLFVMSTNVFAADSELNFFDDTTNQLDISNTTNTNTANNANNANANANINSNTNTNTNTKTSTNTSNYNTSLPKAGAPENTMIGVVATLLVVVSIYAYKKVNQYKNI